MTPTSAYKKLVKMFPQYKYHVVTGNNQNYFSCAIYVIKTWDRRLDDHTNVVYESSSYDKSSPVKVVFEDVVANLCKLQ